MSGDPGWLWRDESFYEPDYYDYVVETESMAEMLMDVETYDDWFPD